MRALLAVAPTLVHERAMLAALDDCGIAIPLSDHCNALAVRRALKVRDTAQALRAQLDRQEALDLAPIKARAGDETGDVALLIAEVERLRARMNDLAFDQPRRTKTPQARQAALPRKVVHRRPTPPRVAPPAPPEKTPGPNEKTQRNTEIVIMRGRGMSLAEIGREFGITSGRVGEIIAAYREKYGLGFQSPPPATSRPTTSPPAAVVSPLAPPREMRVPGL